MNEYKNGKFYKGNTATTESTDEYVEENIDIMNIKYNKVFRSDFNNIEKSVSTVKKYRDNYNKSFNKTTMNKGFIT